MGRKSQAQKEPGRRNGLTPMPKSITLSKWLRRRLRLAVFSTLPFSSPPLRHCLHLRWRRQLHFDAGAVTQIQMQVQTPKSEPKARKQSTRIDKRHARSRDLKKEAAGRKRRREERVSGKTAE